MYQRIVAIPDGPTCLPSADQITSTRYYFQALKQWVWKNLFTLSWSRWHSWVFFPLPVIRIIWNPIRLLSKAGIRALPQVVVLRHLFRQHSLMIPVILQPAHHTTPVIDRTIRICIDIDSGLTGGRESFWFISARLWLCHSIQFGIEREGAHKFIYFLFDDCQCSFIFRFKDCPVYEFNNGFHIFFHHQPRGHGRNA